MGGPVARIVKAVATAGVSEAFQEKPFQGLTKEDRPTKGGGGIGGFVGGGIIPVLAQTGTTGEAIAKGVGGSDREVNEPREQQRLGEIERAQTAERRRVAEVKAYADPTLTLDRARTAARRSGSGKRRASEQLTGALGGY